MRKPEEKVELKRVEEMSIQELQREALQHGIKNFGEMSEEVLRGNVTVRRFVSDRVNQKDAIDKAIEIKNLTGGKWFTATGLVELSRPVAERKGHRTKKGKPLLTLEEANAYIQTLGLFGLLKRRVSKVNPTKYSIRMEFAAKALEDHNNMMRAQKAIAERLG